MVFPSIWIQVEPQIWMVLVMRHAVVSWTVFVKMFLEALHEIKPRFIMQMIANGSNRWRRWCFLMGIFLHSKMFFLELLLSSTDPKLYPSFSWTTLSWLRLLMDSLMMRSSFPVDRGVITLANFLW